MPTKNRPDRKVDEAGGKPTRRDQDIIAPTDADSGILGQAVQAGDYHAFRNALIGYEEWLRKRVGRWVQRYPEADAQIGKGLAIGDIVEAVYLNAFEQYAHRPKQVALHEWIDSLIDPSLKTLMKDPEEESQTASFARTVREIRGLS